MEENKIFIIGISASGKSTYARSVSNETGIPVYHMDSIIWSKDWTQQSEEYITNELTNITKQDKWIIEGWIEDYSLDALKKSDLIIYLDIQGHIAFWRVLKRMVGSGKRSELPKGCIDKFDIKYLFNILLRKEKNDIANTLSKIKNPKVKYSFNL